MKATDGGNGSANHVGEDYRLTRRRRPWTVLGPELAGADLTPYVGAAFRQLREQAGMNLEQAALAAGLDRTYVSGIERSRRNRSLRSMQKVATVLEIDLDELLIKARELAASS